MKLSHFAAIALIGSAAFTCGCATSSPAAESASESQAANGLPVYEQKPIYHEASDRDKDLAKSKSPLTGDAAVLYVNGMGCPLCASNLDIQLLRIKGVSTATIDLGVGTANVTFKGDERPSAWDLHEAVEDAGFSLVRIAAGTPGGVK